MNASEEDPTSTPTEQPPAAASNTLPGLTDLREKRAAAETAVQPGEFVRLQNMVRRPELNGRRGLVCGVTMLGSIKVLMDDTQEQLGVPLDRIVKTGAILVRGT